jgi:Gp157 protein
VSESLWELEQREATLARQLDAALDAKEEAPPEVAAALSEVMEQAAAKRDAVAEFILKQHRQANLIEAEIERLTKLHDRIERRATYMESYVKGIMVAQKVEELRGNLHVLALHKLPPRLEILTPMEVPERFWYSPPPPERRVSKEQVRAALKEGQQVPGVQLVTDDKKLVIY